MACNMQFDLAQPCCGEKIMHEPVLPQKWTSTVQCATKVVQVRKSILVIFRKKLLSAAVCFLFAIITTVVLEQDEAQEILGSFVHFRDFMCHETGIGPIR